MLQAVSLFQSITWMSIPPTSRRSFRQSFDFVRAQSIIAVVFCFVWRFSHHQNQEGKQMQQVFRRYQRHFTAFYLQLMCRRFSQVPQRPTQAVMLMTCRSMRSLSSQAKSSLSSEQTYRLSEGDSGGGGGRLLRESLSMSEGFRLVLSC